MDLESGFPARHRWCVDMLLLAELTAEGTDDAAQVSLLFLERVPLRPSPKSSRSATSRMCLVCYQHPRSLYDLRDPRSWRPPPMLKSLAYIPAIQEKTYTILPTRSTGVTSCHRIRYNASE